MNPAQYIASGILEAYVLGICSPEERAEIDHARTESPEVEAEIAAIEETILLFSKQLEVAPEPALKGKIWEAISETDDTAPTIQRETVAPIRKLSTFNQWFVAASLLFIIGLGTYAWKLHQDMQTATEQLALARAANEKAKQIQRDNQYKIDVLKDPSTAKMVLKSVPTFTDQEAQVTVFWNPSSQDVILADISLPAAPEGKQYQLWALVDGQPIDAGVFDQQEKASLVPMKKIEKSQAFAITLEKVGGSPTPNLDALCVMASL